MGRRKRRVITVKNKPFPSITDIIDIGILKEYGKYEFCKDMRCIGLNNNTKKCRAYDSYCQYTAKEFHHWINKKGYKIVKDNN